MKNNIIQLFFSLNPKQIMFISTIYSVNWNKNIPFKLLRYAREANKSIGPSHYVFVDMNEMFSQFANDLCYEYKKERNNEYVRSYIHLTLTEYSFDLLEQIIQSNHTCCWIQIVYFEQAQDAISGYINMDG